MESNHVSNVRVSKLFNNCPAEVELLIVSSDNILFKVNKLNLAAHSATFADAAAFTQDDTPVQLTESAEVLEVLFQHMYPQPRRPLKHLSVSVVLDLAEAAEKYCVYSALDMCQMRLQNALSSTTERAGYALRILAYASRHANWDLADNAAEATLFRQPSEVLQILDAPAVLAWMLYKESIDRLLNRVVKRVPGVFGNQPGVEEPNNNNIANVCPHWTARREQILRGIKIIPSYLADHRNVGHHVARTFESHVLAIPPHDNGGCYCPLAGKEAYEYWDDDYLLYEWHHRKFFSAFLSPNNTVSG